MGSSLLDESTQKNILFDVLDGIPPSTNESSEAVRFRKLIEDDNRLLEYTAEELGYNNVLFEYLSQG